jgi:BCD family chlorophyll transporter-like MFS transporter
MSRISQTAIRTLVSLGPRFLPFADVATPDLPLGRLLRLSLFQVSVGMALVLMVGTLNRVMIVELEVPASLVAVMISLPLVFAPFRALIGFRSDVHRSALGWRRVPFIWRGTMLQFGGFAVMPFALLVLAGQGESGHLPVWIGQLGAGISFLLVGAGLHMVQTVGLALATDLAPAQDQPKVVGLMYVMLLVGMIVSAMVFGAALVDFTPGRLIQVIQGAAVVTVILNVTAMWKQETRDRSRAVVPEREATFRDAWDEFISGRHARLRLLAIGLGTMGFGMSDVLLEPYGGQVLQFDVASTTKLTATLALGGLIGFVFASKVLARGFDPFRMAAAGALIGIPAFLCIIAAAPLHSPLLFVGGTFLVGVGGGLFSHGTLTATMTHASRERTGLALGTWGAVQATAAGLGMALGGVVRDVVLMSPLAAGTEPAVPYIFVYAIEIALLAATLLAMLPLFGIRPADAVTAIAKAAPLTGGIAGLPDGRRVSS